MWLECTPENWITVDITKCSRKTIPHNRTANRKCTLPELSSCASYSGGSGSQRSEVTYLWLCRVNCYHAGQRDRKDNIFGQFDVRNVSEMTKSLHRHIQEIRGRNDWRDGSSNDSWKQILTMPTWSSSSSSSSYSVWWQQGPKKLDPSIADGWKQGFI